MGVQTTIGIAVRQICETRMAEELNFEDTCAWVKANAMPSSTEEKLAAYGLYKQAMEGDVQGSQPWAVQLEARSKWDAWNKHKGMSQEEAKAAYCKEVAAQRQKHGF